ncbi:Cell division protein FtsZ [hydrothermal vent metagenome]|uniref:Cell division protein FtsZ n=1 Tax=hydrothermal vent metagenome TaxID=652676 RepID=A0A1W1CYW1_9ZZZZ
MEPFIIAENEIDIDINELYSYIDDTEFNNDIKKGIKGMLEIVVSRGDSDINLDFEDVKTILAHGNDAFVGSAEYEGKDAAKKAIELAIKNTSLDINSVNKVAGFLVHFTIHPDMPMLELADAMEILYENSDNKPDIIWGTTTNKSLNQNYIKVTILFTGFGKCDIKNIPANNID